MFGTALKTIIITFLFFISSSVMATSLKVKKKSAKVYEKAKKSSTVIATLKKDDVLTSSGRKGMYWKVKTSSGADGFVSIMKVKRQASKGNKVTSVLRKAAEESRANGANESIRSRSAVMGVRGLDASEQVAFAGNMKPDFRLVYRMEDRQVSDTQVEKIANAVEAEIESKLK